MIYFGVPSFGVHVNGWVRNPYDENDHRPYAMWVAKRSMSKATYPGLFDQMVAGGQVWDTTTRVCVCLCALPCPSTHLLCALPTVHTYCAHLLCSPNPMPGASAVLTRLLTYSPTHLLTYSPTHVTTS